MTIQVEATEQYLFVVTFIILYRVVLTFELMGEIINYNQTNESQRSVLFCGALFCYCSVYFATRDGSKFWLKSLRC